MEKVTKLIKIAPKEAVSKDFSQTLSKILDCTVVYNGGIGNEVWFLAVNSELSTIEIRRLIELFRGFGFVEVTNR